LLSGHSFQGECPNVGSLRRTFGLRDRGESPESASCDIKRIMRKKVSHGFDSEKCGVLRRLCIRLTLFDRIVRLVDMMGGAQDLARQQQKFLLEWLRSGDVIPEIRPIWQCPILGHEL
jgi:hypothetical protein